MDSGSWYPAQAIINLGALAINFSVIRKIIGGEVKILSVVKADAYGHGAVPVARRLQKEGVDMFGVATVQEGILLREAGVYLPILILGPTLPPQEEALFHTNLTPVISSLAQAERLDSLGRLLNRTLPVHIKIDTGMGRLGFLMNDLKEVFRGLRDMGFLVPEGIMSHFSDIESEDFSSDQHYNLTLSLSLFEQVFGEKPIVHMSSSGAIFAKKAYHRAMVRPGLALYGIAPAGGKMGLHPVMRWVSHITLLKELPAGHSVGYLRRYVADSARKIAILPVGYADGYSRRMSNRAEVLIDGVRTPVVGMVSMDYTAVDVTHISAVHEGMEVTLMGRDGEEEVSAGDIAAWEETIPYEVLCRVGKRVKRVYVSGDNRW